MDDKEYSNSDVKTLFNKYDKLLKKVSRLETHAFTELGYRPAEETPLNKGYVWEAINRVNDTVFGNGNMGMKTKVFLVFWVFPFLYTLFGLVLSKIIGKYF